MTSGPHLLADRVRRVRAELGLSQEEFAAKSNGDLKLSTLRNVEGATYQQGPRGPARRGIERAAGWPHGEVDRILAGGTPVTPDTNGSNGASAEVVTSVAPLASMDQLGVLLSEVNTRVADLAAASAQKMADEMLAYYFLNCLSPKQRRVLLTGVGKWLADNPDYADVFA